MDLITIASNVIALTYIHHTLGQYVMPSARYFATHTCINAVIAYRSFGELWRFFESPETAIFCIDGCSDPSPNLLTIALHLYHMLCYDLKPIDRIHHYPAMIANTIMMLYPAGPIQNFTFFFMMGLPGMLDYLMLVLVKYSLLASLAEKRCNALLNMGVRMPGLVLSSFATLRSIVLYPELFQSEGHLICAMFICIHNFWNGTYFAFKAVESYVKHTLVISQVGNTPGV